MVAVVHTNQILRCQPVSMTKGIPKNTNYRENDIELKRVYHRIQGDTELHVLSEQASMMACWGDVHLKQRSCATPIAQITLNN
jgi:hypothetical protein